MVPPSDAPTRKTCFTASLFTTGSVPGNPMHTGHMFTFGCVSSGSFLELQNIFVCVFNSAWISRPMLGTYSPFMRTTVPLKSADSTAEFGLYRAILQPFLRNSSAFLYFISL